MCLFNDIVCNNFKLIVTKFRSRNLVQSGSDRIDSAAMPATCVRKY